jgi:integrase
LEPTVQHPQEAEKNASGVAVATQAASQGLTVAEFQDMTNAGRTTVKVAIERFLKLHRNDRPKTIQQCKNALQHLLANLPNSVRFVNDLATADALDAYLETLERDDYAKKTIATRMGIVFSMLKGYVRETGVQHPSKVVSLPEPVQKRAKAYSNEEVAKLFEAMNAEEKLRYLFFLHTGCREQEVTYATWDDVDFRQRKFHVTGGEKQDVNFVPKNHEERWIPLTTELYDLLKERKSNSRTRWILTNEDGKPEGHFLRKFKAIAKKAGLNCGHCKTTIIEGKYHVRKRTQVSCATRPVCEKHYLHRLRKTCATRWLRSGINLMDIRTWLGHASLAVTQIYLADSEHIDANLQARLDKAGSH